jgi:tetratricopeptide (TPR) repeat protein
VVAHGCLGDLSLAQGDLAHAIRVYEQGLVRCRATGNRNWWRVIAGGLGAAYALQGRLAEGRTLLEEASREESRRGARGSVHWAWLSEVCRLAGRRAEAWQYARQALDLAQQIKNRGNKARALHQLGVVQAHATPPDIAQAEAHYQQALAEALGMRPLQAHCHHSLGTLYAKAGQGEQARAALSTAMAMYRTMDMTFWLPQAEAALAQVSVC